MSFSEALRYQARSNEVLGSPFTARVLRLLAQRLAPGTQLTDRMFDWPGDISARGASLPLRLLGGLHALVLTGEAPELVAAYPPNPSPDDNTLWAAIETALDAHTDVLHHWLDNPPQTNEIRRAAVLIAAGHWLHAHFGLPITLSELGASAGLNLMWDRFALTLPDRRYGPDDAVLTLSPEWRGPFPTVSAPNIFARRGVDLMPLNPHDPGDALRLTSYLWADQPERLHRTQAAIGVADAVVDRGDAADWLVNRLATSRPGQLHLIYHTIAWQYFPSQTQARCKAALAQAGEMASETAPLARFAMEADDKEKGAAMSLQLWPGAHKFGLGRVDFHGRWVDWQAPSATTNVEAAKTRG